MQQLVWYILDIFLKVLRSDNLTSDGTFGYGSYGGDAMMLQVSPDTKYNGGWCDLFSSENRNFLCKALI